MAHKLSPHRPGYRPPTSPRRKARPGLRRLFRLSPKRLLLGLVLVLGYTALLEANLFQRGITWTVGEIASRDIYADRTHEFVDDSETDQLRRTAREQVPKVYEALPVQQDAENRIKQLLEEVGAVDVDPELANAAEREASLAGRIQRLGWFAPPAGWPAAALDLGAAGRKHAWEEAVLILAALYDKREIRDDADPDLAAARATVEEMLLRLPATVERVLQPLLLDEMVLKPNRRYNEEATQQKRDEAAEAVDPVRRTINRGQLIVQRGHRVTDLDLADLKALGLVQPRRDWVGLFSLAALVSLVLVILGTYVRMEQPEVFGDNRRIILLNLVCALFLVAFRALLWLKGEIPSMAHPAIFCGAGAGMVIAVLVEYQLAMMMTSAMGLFMGLLLPGAALWVAFEAWLAGRVGAMVLRHVGQRGGLARAGLKLAVAGGLIAVIVQLPRSGDTGTYQWFPFLNDILFGSSWGLLAFLVAQGLITLLEPLFGCLTPFRLLELTNTSTPLLQWLKRAARGSFDASLTIGDMAADACEAIGADPLLARAAGYHHDIGKIKHPSWFIENQFASANIHDRLEPQMSARAIKSHVALGLELADEFRLPRPLRDVIQQHHGTTRISFFYNQALEAAADGETVDEQLYRYEGPKPQFRESGIIMLADGIEAAVRAVSQHGQLTEKKVGQVVDSLIKARLDDGQLDECDLTLRDLTLAAEAFREFLKGMYHQRIDYPAGAQIKPAAKPARPHAG